MSNRFYSPDKTKWRGRTHIHGDAPEKKISHFIFASDDNISVQKLGASYEEALAVADATREYRRAVQAAGRFTELGVRQELGEFAMIDALPRLKRAATAVERIKAEVAARREKFRPAAPDDDALAEARRAELRSVVRNMPPAERNKYIRANTDNEALVAAVIHAEPLASGLDKTIWDHLRARQIEIEHGDAIAELQDLDEVIDVAADTLSKARDELRETVGVDKSLFESIAGVAERNNGELPFKVEQVPGPNDTMVEVASVYDFERKQWRHATSEEIQKSLAA